MIRFLCRTGRAPVLAVTNTASIEQLMALLDMRGLVIAKQPK